MFTVLRRVTPAGEQLKVRVGSKNQSVSLLSAPQLGRRPEQPAGDSYFDFAGIYPIPIEIVKING
jgi:hypothetical protein